MTKQIKKLLITTLSLMSLLSFSLSPALAFAQGNAPVGGGGGGSGGSGGGSSSATNTTVTNGICNGVDQSTTGSSLNLGQANGSSTAPCTTDTAAGGTVGGILTAIVNVMSILIGVVCVIMIIIGGFKYVTSGGETSNISGAKNTIIYALVGLVVVALAQVIVHFVITRLTGTTS